MKADAFEQLLGSTGIAINITSLGDYRFEHVNRRMCELTGYSESELLGLSVPEITQAEDWRREAAAMERLLGGTQMACAIDKRFIGKDGQIIPVSVKASLIRDDNGTPVRRLSVILRDYEEDWIGRRGQFNTYSREENTGSIARHQRLIGGMQTALELICGDRPLPVILEHIARLMEAVSVDEVIASILLVDPKTRTLHLGAAPNLPDEYNAAIEGAVIGDKAGSCGTAIYSKTPVVVSNIANDPRWQNYAALALEHGLHACWSLPLLDPKRESLGSCAMYYRAPREPSPQDYDTTALLAQAACVAIEKVRRDDRLKASERALQEFSARLETEVAQRTATLTDSLAFQERFLYAFEHELRAPLRSISGFCSILEEDLAASANELTLSLLAKVCESASRMDRLIHSLLKFGRLAPKSIHPQALELGVVISEIVGKQANCEIAAPLPKVFADPQLTATLFRELIANALKFAQPGRPQRVVISGRSAEKKALIAIEDFGIGIADECRPKLFQPFHRFCTDGSYEGSGMGLAIAARAAHLIGGSIRLENGREPTRFVVELPAAQ
ncbi:MAG TPA: ATP-binding protein [Verrucomicrobiae bacterium]|nr:ATP-binding protein [Verrucomicrobiae bacterium]